LGVLINSFPFKECRMEIERQAEIFKAIGDEMRLRILKMLPSQPKCKEMYNISELVKKLGGSQPNMSRHLKILKRAGLVRCEKKCASVYYWKDPAAFQRVCELLSAIAVDIL